MRILNSAPLALLAICLAGTQGSILADSRGHFPGKGDIDHWRKSCPITIKSVEYAERSDYETAIKYAREAISIYPYDSVDYHNLGTDLAQLGKLDEARKAQQKAHGGVPKSFFSLSVFGNKGMLQYAGEMIE